MGRSRSAATYALSGTAGKPAKVALVAGMRKLPTILNAMLRSNTAWNARTVRA